MMGGETLGEIRRNPQKRPSKDPKQKPPTGAAPIREAEKL